MKSRAAIAFEAGKPLEIAEVDVGGPAAGEVMVEIRPRAFAIPMPSRCRAMTPRAPSLPSWVTKVPAWWLKWAKASKTSRLVIM